MINLYGACVRVGKAMGYKRIITYTLESEHGSSVKAELQAVLYGLGKEETTRCPPKWKNGGCFIANKDEEHRKTTTALLKKTEGVFSNTTDII